MQTDNHFRTGSTLAFLVSGLPAATLNQYKLSDLGTYNGMTIAQLIAALVNPNSLNLADLVASLQNAGLTLNDLLAVLPPGFTLHDLFAAILGQAGYDWSNLDLSTFPLAKYATAGGEITYTSTFTATGGSGQRAVTVTAALPTGGVYVAGSGQITPGVPGTAITPQIGATALTFNATITIGTPYTLTWHVRAPLNLGTYAVQANVITAGMASPTSNVVSTTVGQTFDSTPSSPADDQNNDPSSPPTITPGTLTVSQLIRGDTDYYKVPIGTFGSRTVITLSHVPAGSDYDLTVAGPQAPRLRGPALGGIPLTNTQLPDLEPDLNQQSQPLPPETLQDVPSSPLTANGNVIRGQSDNRGNADEQLTLISEGETGFYTIQISNYAGTDANQPYVLEVEQTAPPNLGACAPRTMANTNGTAPGPTPALSASTNTLFLVDEARLRSTPGFAAADVNTLMSKLSALAGRSDLGITGSVVHVEANSNVVTAYNNWDQVPCDPQRANAVVRTIGSYLDTLQTTAPNVKYIVLVGGDDVIPFARVPDETQVANEIGYADQLGTTNNEYRGSTGQGFLLTDDVWTDKGAPDFLGHELFVPELASGRLVEKPADMSKTIDAFTSANGLMTPAASLVSGYDFLSDGATKVNAPFATAFGANAKTLINNTWTNTQLLAGMFPTSGTAPNILSINAHFDHHRLLPANENAAGTQTNLVTTTDITSRGVNAMAGKLGFSMGCHAGLVVSDAIFSAQPVLASDWGQAMLGTGAFGWIGNTGYGLGDTVDVAYSERLSAIFAGKLDGSLTVGQAVAAAKQDYISTLGVISPYDAKVVNEWNLYGLPMLRLGSGIPPAPPPPPPLHTDPATNLQAASFDVSPTFTPVTIAGVGKYYKADNGIQSTPRRPLEPLVSLDITEPASVGVAHGAFLRLLNSPVSDETPFTAVFSQVVTDTSADQTNLTGVTAFPSKPQSISTFTGITGQRQRLNLIVGLFRSSGPTFGINGVQRNYSRLAGDVLYSNSSDWTSPTLGELETLRVGATGTIGLAATVTDVDQNGAPGTVKAVAVIYRDCNGVWRTSSLTPAGGNRWSGGGAVTPAGCQNIDYYLEAADAAGNVAVSSKKVQVEPLVAPPDTQLPGASPITHTLAGTLSASGWYTSGVQVTLSSGDPISYSLDGAQNADYTAPFTVTGDGPHFVAASTKQGATHTFGFVIDGTGPTTKIARTPATPDVNGWYTFNVLVQASAVDSGGSDVAQIRCVLDPGTVPTSFAQLPSSCPYTGGGGNVTTNGVHTVYAAAIDTAGNIGPLVSDTFKFDNVGPTTAINTLSPFQASPSFTAAWTGDDGIGSGVKNFDIRYRQAASNASTFGSYVAWQSANPATSAVFSGTLGSTTCFSGRARDNAGWTTIAYSPEVCTVAPLDDTSLTRSGSWSTVSASDLYNGSVSRSTSVGSTLTSPTMAGKQIGVLVTKQPGGGTIQLRWNGITQVTQSLSAASRTPKQLVSFTLGSVQSGTLQVYVSGAGTVDVDAAGAYKTP